MPASSTTAQQQALLGKSKPPAPHVGQAPAGLTELWLQGFRKLALEPPHPDSGGSTYCRSALSEAHPAMTPQPAGLTVQVKLDSAACRRATRVVKALAGSFMLGPAGKGNPHLTGQS